MSFRSAASLVVVLAVAAASCGDDETRSTSTASSIAVVTSAASATVEPAPVPSASLTTTASPTTATTTATTTTGPATTEAVVPAAWMEVDDLPAWAFPPCCADTWKAPGPSPALPATGAPLDDGVYFADITAWSPARPDRVTFAIHRFERCGALADDTSHECSSWGPDEVFVDTDSIEREIALDDAFEVGITGFACDGTNIDAQQFRGAGPSLEQLWSALEADYDKWVRGPLDAGVAIGDLTIQLAEDPASPFKRTCYGADDTYLELVWTAADGPSVLFQGLVTLDPGADAPAPRRPEQLLLPAALEIRDGRPVLYLYEGYRS